MTRFLSKASLVAGLLGMVGFGAGEARADFLPATGTPTITAIGGGQFRFDYNILVTSTQTSNVGDFFTIYDFGGFVSATAPAGFSVSTALVSPSPVLGSTGGVVPNDNPTITNVTFTRTSGSLAGGPTSLGTFSIVSTFQGTVLASFVGRGTDTDSGLRNANLTNVPVAAIPEPASLVLLGMGVPVALLLRRRRSA